MERRHAATGERESELFDIAPLGVLQDDPVAIRVFIGTAADFPVRVQRIYLLEASCHHIGARSLPLGQGWYVEDHQVLCRGRRRNRMGSTVRELEVITRTTKAEHDAVEPFMVLEAVYNAQA
jgi:hypothetical protein